MQFCTGVDISDVVTPANFGSHRFRRFRMSGVEFQVFPLTFNVVLITPWHYRGNPGGNPKDVCPRNMKWLQFSPIFLLKNSFNVKYLKDGDRYHNGVNGSRIWNHPWAIDWHHDLWPWMTLNRPRSMSSSNISNTVRGTILDTMEVR